jgi:tetratricopeptide (TPR) repeat protein
MMKVAVAIISVLLLSTFAYAQRKSVDKYLQLAQQMADLNQDEKSLAYLDTVLHKHPQQKDALFLRGRLNSNMQQYRDALTDYLTLIEIDPENKEAHYSCGVVRYHLGQYRMAIPTFSHCLQLATQPTNTVYFKIDPLEKTAFEISTMHRMDIDIWNYIGLCHYQLHEFDAALSAFGEGIGIDNNSIDLLTNRALTYEALGEIDRARTDYMRVLSQFPEHETASLNMARLQTEEDRMRTLNSFISTHPNHPQGYANRGNLHFQNMNYQAAEKDFMYALVLYAENNDYLFNAALAKLKTDNFNESEELFMELIDRDPQHAGAYFNLGNIHYTRKSFDTACSYYTIAVQLQPASPSYLFNRALAWHENGQHDEACEDMRLANQIDPGIGNDFLKKYCNSEAGY